MAHRRRKWTWLAWFVAVPGCIRFPSDTVSGPDSAADAPPSGEPDGGDAAVPPPPICEGRVPSFPQDIAAEVVTGLFNDCRVQEHFKHLLPVRLAHFEECLAAQLGSVLGCVHPDGQPFKYPTFDSNGVFCRDMKSGHGGMAASDGDFDAFVQVVGAALMKNKVEASDVMRVASVFGAVRVDIVRLKDAGPTAPCDRGDAGDAGGDEI